MKTILFINACLRGEASRTLKIAKTYLSTLDTHDAHLIERDLTLGNVSFYTKDAFDESTGETIKPFDPTFAKEFASADEIIVAAPYWEFVFPASLSCYLEMVAMPGIAFRYTERGSQGLCKAEKLTYIYSAGAPLQEEDKVGEHLFKKLCDLFGIPAFSAHLAEGLDIDMDKAPLIVENICNKIKNQS